LADQDLPGSPDQPAQPGQPGGGDNPLPFGDAIASSHLPVNIEEEMRRSYLDYAMSVIIGRALPDVRDGLKPVHRRILYGMSEMGLAFNRPTRKCAKIVGEVLGKYHPHGDGAVYDSLVRMAQPFSMRYPLIDGQGNFGSVDGDPPAAMRYTEARLGRIAASLLEDIDKETVDFRANYDDSEHEPEVLPTRVPNLLINGSEGIAVGMATKIPPHNLTEIVEATIALIREPETPITEIMKMVQGPDFPTGGYILGRTGIWEAFNTGRGSIKLRARAEIEPIGKDRQAIIVTEIPYQVNKARLIENTAGLVNEKKIEGISEIRDESDRKGMRIVFELKRGENAEVILNNLYKHTQLQTSFGVIMLSIVNGQPRELGLLDCIRRFIEHRVEVVRRRTDYELRKAREREHLLLGFQKALDNLDEVIELIRRAANPKEAKARLVERFEFTERQAQAIIELQLQRLTGMEQQKILDELQEIQRRIARYLEILGSEEVLRGVIIDELEEIKAKFGDARRTEIIEDPGELNIEDLIADENVVVTVSRSGYVKRVALDIYRRQRRGGVGRMGMTTRAEDLVEQLIVASTHTSLMCFTNLGRVYIEKIYNVPDAGPTSKGKHVSGLLNLMPGETVQTFLPIKNLEGDQHIVMVTRKGVIKKTLLSAFANINARGIIAISLDDDDELIAARLTAGDAFVFLASRDGKAILFKESEVRAMGRPARGVRGMMLAKGDYIVSMAVPTDPETPMLAISERGFGKRTPVSAYRETGRGAKGVINMKTTSKTGKVVTTLQLPHDDAELMLITRNGQLIRTGSDQIRKAGRASQGVTLVRVDEGDLVASAAVIPDEPENGNGNGNEAEQGTLPLQ
jgi:DNA gyrase subunit A